MDLQQFSKKAAVALGVSEEVEKHMPVLQVNQALASETPEAAVSRIKELEKSIDKGEIINPENLRRRLEAIEKRQRTHAAIAEIGKSGVLAMIAEYGIGGVVDELELNHADFRAWLTMELSADSVTIAESQHAELLLSRAERVFDEVPHSREQATHNSEKARAFIDLAGIFDRRRARTAPKLDIAITQQKAVEVNIFAGIDDSDKKAADKGRAQRQMRLAQARVDYGTGDYVNPPAVQAWINGEFSLEPEDVNDYLMLKRVPEIALAYSDVLEGELSQTKTSQKQTQTKTDQPQAKPYFPTEFLLNDS